LNSFFLLKENFKIKKVRNPNKNGWNESTTNAKISINGLQASDNGEEWLDVFAKEGFAIAGENCRPDHFLGIIIYYFEITQTSLATEDG
jgi:hypothetical protein